MDGKKESHHDFAFVERLIKIMKILREETDEYTTITQPKILELLWESGCMCSARTLTDYLKMTKLLFFDCAFDLMEGEAYLKMQRGLLNLKLSLYPDEELIAQRKAYFDDIRKKNENSNLQYSEERIFQNEVLNTLRLVFENDFIEYLG